MFSKFLDPKNDYAFKKIFGTDKHKNILIHFLNDIIEFPGRKKILTVTFLNTSQNPEIVDKKESIIDVLCFDETGAQYIVEMQVAHARGFAKRAQYYAAKAYSSQMNKGDEYENLKEIIFLAITDFEMFPDKKAYKSDHCILDRETQDRDLKDFSFTFLELPKFTKTIDELENIVDKWAYFFKHAPQTTPEDMQKLVGDAPIIAEAYEVLDRFYWTQAELMTYEKEIKNRLDFKAILAQKEYEGLEKGKKIGIAKGEKIGIEKGKKMGIEKGKKMGVEEGKKEEQLRIGAALLNEKILSMQQICQITGLDQHEVEKLLLHSLQEKQYAKTPPPSV